MTDVDQMIDRIDEKDRSIIVAIDPSINSLGYAIGVNSRLILYGTITSDEGERALPLATRIQQQVSDLAQRLPSSKYPQLWIVEEPQMFGSATGHAATANNSVKKLIMVVGAIVWHAALMKASIVLVPVGVWKGQLPKHVTTSRSEKKYGVKFKTSDEADAVSLLDWYLTEAK